MAEEWISRFCCSRKPVATEVFRAAAAAYFPSLQPTPPDKASDLVEVSNNEKQQYWQFAGGDHHHAISEAMEEIDRKPRSIFVQIYMILLLLSTRLGTLLLAGSLCLNSKWPFIHPFQHLPADRRLNIICSWRRTGSLGIQKQVFSLLCSLTLSCIFGIPEATPTQPACIDQDDALQGDKNSTGSGIEGSVATSVVWKGMGFPGPQPQKELRKVQKSALNNEAKVMAATLDLPHVLAGCPHVPATYTSPGVVVPHPCSRGPTDELPSLVEVLKERGFDAQSPPEGLDGQLGVHVAAVVTCGVVVVGSGAGGAVAAAVLSQAGQDVVVLEKGRYTPIKQLQQVEGLSLSTMYDNGGFQFAMPAPVGVIAGSTLGGGTRVNWTGSLKTPAHVRREMAGVGGVGWYATSEYDEAMDAVYKRLQVDGSVMHSGEGGVLVKGMQGIGLNADNYPRSCRSRECSKGCQFGCARGMKQDTTQTWLLDAVGGGAKIITGVTALKVLTSAQDKTLEGRDKKATGVVVRCCLEGVRQDESRGVQQASPPRDVYLVVTAPTVISAGGSVQTPALLLRSGITCQGAVGRNLRLHPCVLCYGVMPASAEYQGYVVEADVADIEDLGGGSGVGRWKGVEPLELADEAAIKKAATQPVEPWRGALMSSYSRHLLEQSKSGYGTLIVAPSAAPGIIGPLVPWKDPFEYKYLMGNFGRLVSLVVLQRDEGSGQVRIDAQGRPLMEYKLSPGDRTSLTEGFVLACRALRAAGAELIVTSQQQVSTFTLPTSDARLLPGFQDGYPDGDDDTRFATFLDRVQSIGIRDQEQGIASAHQMSSCCMGSTPGQSALDEQGQTWEAAGLYVMDGSALPVCSGVNPMVTISSTAYVLATRLAARLKSDK